MIQYHFHTQPSEFRSMTDDEFVREYAKIKYIVESQKESQKERLRKEKTQNGRHQ